MKVSAKQKIRLTAEQEMFLVPLSCKGQPDNAIFVDEHAQDILGRIEYDFSQLDIHEKTYLTSQMRAMQIDIYPRGFLTSYPDSTITHLGCGLDGRFLRLENIRGEVVRPGLSRRDRPQKYIFPETSSYHLIPTSVTDLGWINTISHQGNPTLVIAEGLFMYLTQEEVKALVLRLKESFPGCQLVIDAYSQLTAKRAKVHPSLKKTGAVIRWRIDNPKTIERWAQGIRLQEEWFFTQLMDVSRLGWGYRLAFSVAAIY